MGRLATLKRYARAQIEELDLELPVFSWEETDDPVKMNAIYSPREWKLDSPVSYLTERRQDWMHWYACDPAEKTSLELYFGRYQQKIASTWVRLRVNDRLLVLKEAFYYDNSDGHAYHAGGIRLECTAPMRRWRLALNVIMEEPATGSKLHVRLGAQVAMVGHTFELPKNVRASFLARRYVHEENLEKAKFEISKCCSESQAILQPNTIFIEVSLDGQKQELMLFGSRLKFFGTSNFLEDVPIHIGYAENGTTFTAIKVGKKAYGFCCNPADYVQPIRKTKWSRYKPVQGSTHLLESFSAEVAGRSHEFKIGMLQTSLVDDAQANGELGCLWVDKKVFRMQSTLLELPKRPEPPKEKVDLCELLQYPYNTTHHLILSTSEAECKNPKLTGGKGSSLAVLTDISKRLKSFTVPSGVVLTVNAYKMFAETPEISAAIEEFIEGTKGADMTSLKAASDKCVATISDAILPLPIQTQLAEKLFEVFGFAWYSKKFAVRSSAVGEDSEEMSAAGQMTTFLGMKGERKISAAVVKCWASQFALTAINYKRQYGQDLNSNMAVVVQEMVSAQSAGVMFTCDPVTSNPSGIFITANFGLGESVVSATADPDTYSLRREGTEVSLEAKSRGAKDRMIVELEFGNGTEEKTIPSDKAQSFCLSDERAIKIASIGAALHDITDSPRDIEWAVIQGQIFLLQSRPVTSFLRETDYEIRHDLNSGFYTNREILSRANLDEVMPGAFSPLGTCVVSHLLFETFGKMKSEMMGGTDRSQFTFIQHITCGKKNFMNFSKNAMAHNKTAMKSTGVTMFGYDITEDEALKNGIIHDTNSNNPSGFTIVKHLIGMLRNVKKNVEEAQLKAAQLKFDLPEKGDSLALFMSTVRQMPKLQQFMDGLMAASMPSGIYNVITLNILKKSQGEEDYTPEIMIMLSKILKSDLEVESAHIPKELTVLSNMLREDPSAENFMNMSLEDALTWLETDEGAAAKEFRTLRDKHAHRCYKEFDIHSKTWDIDPIPLVRTLQSTVQSPDSGTQKKDEEPLTIDQLPKRPSLMQKKILNFLIPRAQYAVYAREATKSALIKSIHGVRLAMRRVGLQLQAEGRIPDAELVFFLTCDEIYRLITTRDPSLLPRAFRRQKMHPILDQERFPVLLYGMPKPIDSSTITIDPNAQSIQGTPVSEGVVVGPARVILDFLTEAHLIKKGEILITRATDTGWTPYFPLLGGVVTEVGGLLSHGAVVAREYGLPAVVGVIGVTDFVKTGDIVTLDGNKGILHKSPPAQPEETEGATSLPQGEQTEGNTQPEQTGELAAPASLKPDVVNDNAVTATDTSPLISFET